MRAWVDSGGEMGEVVRDGEDRRKHREHLLIDCDVGIVADEWVFTGYWDASAERYERERRSGRDRRDRQSAKRPVVM